MDAPIQVLKDSKPRSEILLLHTCVRKAADALARHANRLLLEEAELLIEAADPTATINQVLVATSPGRVSGRINVQLKVVAFLAPG